MSLDFDNPPLYDTLTKKNEDTLSDIWVGYLSTFYQTLIEYLTQNGIFIPPLTSSQRDAITTPKNGQVIYNTTLDKFQGYQAGTWKTFTLT